MSARKPSLAKAKVREPESRAQLSSNPQASAQAHDKKVETTTAYLVHMAQMGVNRCRMTTSQRHTLLGRIAEGVMAKLTEEQEDAVFQDLTEHHQKQTG